jgi:biopolymer transport protein ExbB
MAYGYYGQITIDSDKVSGSSNLTNFPVLISGTYDGTGSEPDIRTVANGGKIQNTASGGVSGSYTVPADLVFSPNTDGSSPYDFEIESYDATTGAIIAWVKIPTLDYDDDTILYMVYGDSGVTTSQEDIANTWTAYNQVLHLTESPDGTSGEVKDSKGALNGTGGGGFPATTTGKVGKGMDFNSGDNEYINFGDSTILDGASAFTVEAWINPDSLQNYGMIHRKWGDEGWSTSFQATQDELRMDIQGTGSYNVWYTTNADVTVAGGWFLCTWVYDNSQSVTDMGTFYVNLSTPSKNKDSNNNPGTLVNNSAHHFLGTNAASGGFRIDAQLDEVRLKVGVVTQGWAYTNYNTQNDPSTFYAMGNETANGGGGGGGEGISASRRIINC